MPELPEVETTRRGISPHILGSPVMGIDVRQAGLRWPVPANFAKLLQNASIIAVDRRGKYLLLRCSNASTIIIHLGMSGSLRIAVSSETPKKHDHVDIVFKNGNILRYHDPRRFGCILLSESPEEHFLLASLGPEPLSDEFDGEYLFTRSRKKLVAVKSFIMNSHVVVGVGNIYANEALFAAGVRPTRKAGTVTRKQYVLMASAIKEILSRAIEVGGTTLRDFVGGDGKPGYFRQSLMVYGRGGEACKVCGRVLKEIRLAQRSTVYCQNCQK